MFKNHQLSQRLITKTEISALYVSLFGRASEGAGNKYWMNLAHENNLSAFGVADLMLKTEAAKSFFGDSMNNNRDYIEHIYSTTLNKKGAIDSEGKEYWIKLLDDGVDRGVVTVSLLRAAVHPKHAESTDYATREAHTLIINKIKASNLTADTTNRYSDKNDNLTIRDDLRPFIKFNNDMKSDALNDSYIKTLAMVMEKELKITSPEKMDESLAYSSKNQILYDILGVWLGGDNESYVPHKPSPNPPKADDGVELFPIPPIPPSFDYKPPVTTPDKDTGGDIPIVPPHTKVSAPSYYIPIITTGLNPPDEEHLILRDLTDYKGKIPPLISYYRFYNEFLDKTISPYGFIQIMKGDDEVAKNKQYWIRDGFMVDKEWHDELDARGLSVWDDEYAKYKLTDDDWDVLLKNLDKIDGVSTQFGLPNDKEFSFDSFRIPIDKVNKELLSKFYPRSVQITGVKNRAEHIEKLKSIGDTLVSFSTDEIVEISSQDLKEILVPHKGNYHQGLAGLGYGAKIKINDFTGDLSSLLLSDQVKDVVFNENDEINMSSLSMIKYKDRIGSGKAILNISLDTEPVLDEFNFGSTSRDTLYEPSGIYANFPDILAMKDKIKDQKIYNGEGYLIHLKNIYQKDGDIIDVADHFDMFNDQSLYLIGVESSYSLEKLKSDKVKYFDVKGGNYFNITRDEASILMPKAGNDSLIITDEITASDTELLTHPSIAGVKIRDGEFFSDINGKLFDLLVKKHGTLTTGDYKVTVKDFGHQFLFFDYSKLNIIEGIDLLDDGYLYVEHTKYDLVKNKLTDPNDGIRLKIDDNRDDLVIELEDRREIIKIDDNEGKIIIKNFEKGKDLLDLKFSYYLDRENVFLNISENEKIPLKDNGFYGIKVDESVSEWDFSKAEYQDKIDGLVKKHLYNDRHGVENFYSTNGYFAISGNDDTIIFDFWLTQDYPDFTHENFRSYNVKIVGVTELTGENTLFDS